MWTTNSVRAALPDVEVQLRGEILVMGRVYGRENRFATVVTQTLNPLSLEYAWSTIARSLNTNTPLTV